MTSNDHVQAVRVHISGLVNSFRAPTSQTHQTTLPHPPRTTLLGFLGAAFGLPPEECLSKGFSESFEFAIIEDTSLERQYPDIPSQWQGTFSDLWRYRKYKNGVFEIPDILLRDGLYLRSWWIYIIPKNARYSVENLALALNDPKWCLSLGREDELVRAESIKIVDLHSSQVTKIGRTILPIDAKRGGMLKVDLQNCITQKSGVRSLSGLKPPVVLELPQYFEFATNGSRAGKGYSTYSFIESQSGFVLDVPMPGYRDDDGCRELVPF